MNFFSFSFSFISFLPPQAKAFSNFPKFQSFTTSTHFHTLPPTSTINAPPSLSLPWPAKWPKEGHSSPPPLCKNPPLFYLIASPLQIQTLFKHFLYILFPFSSLHQRDCLHQFPPPSQPQPPTPKFHLGHHLHLNHYYFGLGSYLSSSVISPWINCRPRPFGTRKASN